jgi:hypothetical protein
MKKLFMVVSFLFFCTTYAQENKKTNAKVVEVSCGQCKFGMTDKKGCDLAVRIAGAAYFIDGTSIDEHGDAHAKDGFCSAIRKAEVIGEIKNNTFVVSYFKLLPIKKK